MMLTRPADNLPTVSVIVLNYNGLRHLEPCFTSLLALDYPLDKLELMFVDNASSDGSVAFMRERFPSVRVVETGANLGFAAGNNYGAERATGEYVAFLNNDTRVEPGWLFEMVLSVLTGRERGVVCTSSLMLDWNGDKIDFQAGGVNFHGFGFQPAYGRPYRGQQIEPRDLLFACGGSMLVDRSIFLEVGGFDPDYFAFFEDVDLGWRLWLLGHRVTLTPRAITYHRHHGTASGIGAHRTYLLYERNALYTIYKNYSAEHMDTILSAALLLLGQRAVRFLHIGGTGLDDFDWNNPPDESQEPLNVHRSAVAALLAANEFSDNLEKMRAKREWLQARRVRTDEELFVLFGQPGRVHLVNHETDTEYAVAHYALLSHFGIEDLWANLPKEVLVVSPDVLPVGKVPASGAGIRAWALGKGLEARGHHVHFTMPAAALEGRRDDVPQEYVAGAWTPGNLQTMIEHMVPDVVVSCGWPNVTWLPRPNVPVSEDLTGPHLLERLYQGSGDASGNSEEKVAALAKGDFFTCIGVRQTHYFTAWLAQAGIAVQDLAHLPEVVPYSLDPDLPKHLWPASWDGVDVHFVYGGIFLPWQDPAPALLAVAATLDAERRGMLEVYGGKHPFHAVHTGGYAPLVERLSTSPRVSVSGLLPHDRLVERYTRAHVAVDVMQPNAERALAFPSRTVHYLWCGLPVIHPWYSEVAEHIREYEAGWVVRHDDPDELAGVIRAILADPSEARRRGENAQLLARERFTWDRTIDPLDAFVRRPFMRPERGEAARRARALRTRTGTATARIVNRREAAIPAGHELPAKLEQAYRRRRRLPAQVVARTGGLVRGLVANATTRGRTAGGALTPMPEVIAGHSLGQRFLCPHDGLSGIRVRVATFGRRNTARLALRLRVTPASPSLFALEVPTHTLHDGDMVAFRFAPIVGSGGQWFYFAAESPDGVPGDSVSLYGSAAGDQPGQRYEDGLPASGSLAYSLEFNGVTE